MLPGITPMHAAASLGNDAYTKLLLHCDGANGSTVLTDSSPAAHGNATMAGTEQLSTAQFKFGTASLFNNGGGYCTFTNGPDWGFSNGDFTVDWWEYRTGVGCVIARDLPTTFSPWLLGFNVGAGSLVYMTSTGSSWDIANGQLLSNAAGNVWRHLAVVRQGSAFYTFDNGVQQATWTSAASIAVSGNPLCIGAAQNGQNYHGYVDELRISKGIARWTANFTPPTAPYS